MQFQNSLFAVTSDHDETLEHCRVQSSIAEATSWLTYHFCFSVVFKLRYCLVAVSCLFVCLFVLTPGFIIFLIGLSKLSLLSLPLSCPVLSCPAVNCFNPCQLLCVFVVPVHLSLFCDLTVTCFIFKTLLHSLFFNMCRPCMCFVLRPCSVSDYLCSVYCLVHSLLNLTSFQKNLALHETR